ncbi:PE domain-containing protein, partial [Mycobacterium avium]|uniref:PE domain-containing protein n=1 Tax=Mycobacterium avium TaxID=1764 RepID=UPI001F18045D
MVADSVRVDTEVVRAAGQQAQAAGATATPGSNQVQPSASDMVSVGASTRFTAQVSLARKYTAMANTQARQFGVKLNASAAGAQRRGRLRFLVVIHGGTGVEL